HLPNHRFIVINADTSSQDLLQHITSIKTMSLMFLDYNSRHTDEHEYTYQEFPQHFVYSKQTHSRTHHHRGFQIERMFMINPTDGERCFLRMLLTIVRGPKSFTNLHMIDGTTWGTFKETCIALGLLADDSE